MKKRAALILLAALAAFAAPASVWAQCADGAGSTGNTGSASGASSADAKVSDDCAPAPQGQRGSQKQQEPQASQKQQMPQKQRISQRQQAPQERQELRTSQKQQVPPQEQRVSQRQQEPRERQEPQASQEPQAQPQSLAVKDGASAQASISRVPQDDRWGAIVFDKTTGQAGSAADEPTQAQAEQAAFAKCLEYGSPNCRVILSYANQCAAVAASVTESGFAAGTTQEKAQTRALERCGQERGCRIVYSHCSVPGRTP